jgi:ketosteroid isomerase-like protein
MSVDHRSLVDGLVDAMHRADWEAVERFYTADVAMEYPQSGEVFRGIANVRATFEKYPGGLDDARLQTENVITEQPQYAITPMYTAVAVEGSGNRGTVTFRATYPDRTIWWVVIQYQLEGERIAHSKVFFAPAFEPPDWRSPYREPATDRAPAAG